MYRVKAPLKKPVKFDRKHKFEENNSCIYLFQALGGACRDSADFKQYKYCSHSTLLNPCKNKTLLQGHSH